MSTKKNEPPKPSTGDHLHALARAGIGSIPIVGSVGVELFNAVVMPPLERRRNEWMTSVAEDLARIERTAGLRLEELQTNESFISSVMQATQTALRSHQQQKLSALRNAVLNAAMPQAPEASVQQIFLNLVDAFTEWHLGILRLLGDPPRFFSDQGRDAPRFSGSSSVAQLIEVAFPALRGRREIYDLIGNELYSSGLTGTESYHAMMTATGALQKRTTSFGDRFLQFITEPRIQ